MKEFLSIREIEYQSINVLDDAQGLDEFTRLGARSVPIVSRGDQWVSALSASNVIEFLQLDESSAPTLSGQQLVSRLIHVLESACRYTRQFSDQQLTLKLAGRDRSYRQIAHHIFNIPIAFLDAYETGQTLSYESTVTAPPEDMHGREAIAAFGESVIQRLQSWWLDFEPGADLKLQQPMQTYYGKQSVHEMLERTTWHSTQHVRQIISLLESLDVKPIEPLTAADLEGLPLPAKVWD